MKQTALYGGHTVHLGFENRSTVQWENLANKHQHNYK